MIKKPIRSKIVKFSFKKNQAIRAEVAGIRKNIDTVLLAEFFLIKYIKILESNKIKATIRKSRGQDIDAACGQLANKS